MPKHTTLRLSEALVRDAKAYATRHGLTLTAVMERALIEYLSRPKDAKRPAVKLPAFGRGGPRPGVDIDDTSALYDLMDGLE